MRMLADFGAIDGVEVTSHRTKGYRDLLTVGVVGAEVCSITFKFDGRRYQNMNDIDCKAREDIAEEKSGSPASARGQTDHTKTVSRHLGRRGREGKSM